MTACSVVQGSGSLVGFLLSPKSSCLGQFAGDSITSVSHFTERSQSWDAVDNLDHMQAFLFWKYWRGPGWWPVPPCCSTGFVPVSQTLHTANFSSQCFTSKSKGWASLCCYTTFLVSPRNEQNTWWDTIFCHLVCSVSWPCNYTHLSVLCSVLCLAHPFYRIAPSTCCSLKCRCQSLSVRASLSAH